MTDFDRWVDTQLRHHAELFIAALETHAEVIERGNDGDSIRSARRIAAEHGSIIIALAHLKQERR